MNFAALSMYVCMFQHNFQRNRIFNHVKQNLSTTWVAINISFFSQVRFGRERENKVFISCAKYNLIIRVTKLFTLSLTYAPKNEVLSF